MNTPRPKNRNPESWHDSSAQGVNPKPKKTGICPRSCPPTTTSDLATGLPALTHSY